MSAVKCSSEGHSDVTLHLRFQAAPFRPISLITSVAPIDVSGLLRVGESGTTLGKMFTLEGFWEIVCVSVSVYALKCQNVRVVGSD